MKKCMATSAFLLVFFLHSKLVKKNSIETPEGAFLCFLRNPLKASFGENLAEDNFIKLNTLRVSFFFYSFKRFFLILYRFLVNNLYFEHLNKMPVAQNYVAFKSNVILKSYIDLVVFFNYKKYARGFTTEYHNILYHNNRSKITQKILNTVFKNTRFWLGMRKMCSRLFANTVNDKHRANAGRDTVP